MKLGITMLTHKKDDIQFFTEFPCLLGNPVFEMLLPKSCCREYADIDPTCQISGFQLCKIDWTNLANRFSKKTLTELSSLAKFFAKFVCVGCGKFQQTLTVVFQDR